MKAATDGRAKTAQPRKRNARGEGDRLREEIIVGATAVLERTGSEEAVTLRAVAREVGIAAPSIARHFDDLPAIIDAVVARELNRLYEAMQTADNETNDPVRRLLDLCRAYVDYGLAYPARYRILIGRRYLDDWEDNTLVMESTAPIMAAALGLVTDAIGKCAAAGDSTSTDAYFDTLTTWFALHGLVTVPTAITSLAWPDHDDLFTACVARAAQLTRIPGSPGASATG